LALFVPLDPASSGSMVLLCFFSGDQNDRYLQNLAYLRLKNLTIGYTVPENLTRKIGITMESVLG